MNLRIITWNLWDKNEHPMKAIQYATGLGADIICLQELPEYVLPQLEKIEEYALLSARDCKTARGDVYLGILLHKDLNHTDHKVIKHKKDTAPAPIDHYNKCERAFLESHSVCVRKKSRVLAHITNCHLRANGSMIARNNDLREVIDAHASLHPRIIVGDFNTMGSPAVNWVVVPLFGAKKGELGVNEIALLKRLATEKGFDSLFEDIVTHPSTRRHLDHVFVTKHAFIVLHKKVLKARHRSDHRGLLVDLETP